LPKLYVRLLICVPQLHINAICSQALETFELARVVAEFHVLLLGLSVVFFSTVVRDDPYGAWTIFVDWSARTSFNFAEIVLGVNRAERDYNSVPANTFFPST